MTESQQFIEAQKLDLAKIRAGEKFDDNGKPIRIRMRERVVNFAATMGHADVNTAHRLARMAQQATS